MSEEIVDFERTSYTGASQIELASINEYDQGRTNFKCLKEHHTMKTYSKSKG